MKSQKKKGIQSPLETTNFDRVKSFLLSSIGICGTVVLGLFLIWLTSSEPVAKIASPFPETETVAYELDFETAENLALEDFPEDIMPQEKFEDLIESVEAVTDQLSTVNDGGSDGDGLWDGGKRGTWPPTPSPSESQRWELDYVAKDRDEYAQQLDHFGIELGAVSLGDNRIFRFRQLSGEVSWQASSRELERESLYFAHKNPRLKNWDKTLVRPAGLEFDYGLVHFFSEEVAAQMRTAELKYVGDRARSLEDVQRTSFEIIPGSDGWKIRVASLEFHENGKGH